MLNSWCMERKDNAQRKRNGIAFCGYGISTVFISFSVTLGYSSRNLVGSPRDYMFSYPLACHSYFNSFFTNLLVSTRGKYSNFRLVGCRDITSLA